MEKNKRKFNFGEWFDNLKLPFNKFYLFLLVCLVTSVILAGISFRLYQVSGAEALDLSRPSYKKERETIKIRENDPKVDDSGDVNQEFFKKANSSLDFYKDKIKVNKEFNGSLISDENLGLLKTETN